MSEYKTKAGSAGSLIGEDNIKKYSNADKLDEYTPNITDKKIEVNADAFRMPTNSESVRRQNNRVRDHKRRWAVITAPISVEKKGVAEEIAEDYAGTESTEED